MNAPLLIAALAMPQDPPPRPEALAAARTAWAHHFLDGPKVHLELAKAQQAAGHLELAVAICEETRHRFGDRAFDADFAVVFAVAPDPEPTGELAQALADIQSGTKEGDWQALKDATGKALERFPRSSELHAMRARALQALEQDAKKEWLAAAELAPHTPDYLGWAARYLWKVDKDPVAALPLYLRTYLLSPHTYETGFVAERITQEIGPELSFAIYTRHKDAGDFRTVLGLDSFWGVERGVAKLDKEWKPEFVADAVRMLAHDTTQIRWSAAEVLMNHAADVGDDVLAARLQDPDLRVRGLAIYVAAAKRREKVVPTAREFLASDCQLLRFDAISALTRYGGSEGKQLLEEQAKVEKDPKVKEVLDSRSRRR
jgi:hypothetical protein